MSLRLVDDRSDGTIPVRDMRDGQIGVITEWGGSTVTYHGAPILRQNSSLINLNSGGGWDVFKEDAYRVRVLSNGTRLEVTDNE